jgi:hypothetical protein
MANQQIFYVYEHWRLDRDECFYVGKGCKNRAYSRSGRNTHWANIVAKLERTGSAFEVKFVKTGMTEDEAFSLEKQRILFWKDKVDLSNKTDGGDGISGFVMPDEAKIKMSKKAKGRIGVKSMLGRKHSEATKMKMRAAKLGKKPNNAGKKCKTRTLSVEHRAKLSEAKKGRILSIEHRAKLAVAAKRQWGDPKKRPNRLMKVEI